MTKSIYAKDLDACRAQLAEAERELEALAGSVAGGSDEHDALVQAAVRTLRENAAACVTRSEGVDWVRWTAKVDAYDEVLTLWTRAIEDGPRVPE